MPKVSFRVGEEEQKRLMFEAKAAGISLSELVRMRVLRPTTQDDFESYKLKLETDFQRIQNLLCDMIATQQLSINIASATYGRVNTTNAAEVLQGLVADFDRLKEEARKNV